jgi:hypothetical protein
MDNIPSSPGGTPADGAISAGPEIPTAGAPDAPGPANPSRADAHGWYDAPRSTEELVRGEAQSEGKEPGEGAPAETREPGQAGEIAHRIYADFKAEGVSLDPKGIADLNGLIDHAVRQGGGEFNHQEFRDGLLQRHVQEMRRYGEAMQNHQRQVWNDLTERWKGETRQAFGNHLESALATSKGLIEQYGGTREQINDLLTMLDHTGLGNHVALVRMFDRLGRILSSEGQMVGGNPSARGAPGGASGSRGWYNNSR